MKSFRLFFGLCFTCFLYFFSSCSEEPIYNDLSNIGNNANYIISESAGAYNLSGVWYGSLQYIEPHRGYWLIINESIRLSKKYGAVDGHKYVNAVLDRIYKSNSE